MDGHLGKRLELRDEVDSERFDQSLALYLITRDLLRDLDAVGGGFMSQLEWGSDRRGIPLPVADAMESFFNSTFDHNGPQGAARPSPPRRTCRGCSPCCSCRRSPAATRRSSWTSARCGSRGSCRRWRRRSASPCPQGVAWAQKGLVDGDNSGSASLDWAAKPGASMDEIMAGVCMPLADEGYFPGMGNSVTYVSPGGLAGIAGRLTYSSLSGLFSLSWDEATTAEVPEPLATALCQTTTAEWPHTFVVPKYATMGEYKHYPPANHFHMIQGLSPARLEYWMDLNNVLSANPGPRGRPSSKAWIGRCRCSTWRTAGRTTRS